ncbi:hypothetical protein M7I_3649 [Glarea lozoyensis 74030]|uniref:Uncharacterized protein n=1 Tax=Glarea lozoyensis (strain ATCC 74030 / MF5533) TaxID=1104152 RepID=H0EM23_GLAL7|nr:hypothetical protein M7I_3649 [Glarea lozoyensis 74030]
MNFKENHPNSPPSHPRNHTSHPLPLQLLNLPLPSAPRWLLTHDDEIANADAMFRQVFGPRSGCGVGGELEDGFAAEPGALGDQEEVGEGETGAGEGGGCAGCEERGGGEDFGFEFCG